MEKSANMNFKLINQKDVHSKIAIRPGEIKIGESIKTIASLNELDHQQSRFVVLGIPEDVGPRANCGIGGADSAWENFLNKFLNLQENQFLHGESILLLGAFDFSNDLSIDSNDLDQLREGVAKIDDEVSPLIERIVANNKIPIVIGGGHNNSYGILKGASKALKTSLNCLNMDPHADYRALEGRHSGNGFSYAKKEGYLEKYFVCGLHQNYNAQNMLDRMIAEGIGFNFYDHLIQGLTSFQSLIDEGLAFVKNNSFGLELDCDSIENFPSSAQTPSGISSNQAREYVVKAAQTNKVVYLHLPEAAPSLVEGSESSVGKLLSYLVSDFIKTSS